MKKVKVYILLCVLHCSALLLPAQNENKKWYFGSYAALDFMTNPPTVLNNSAMGTIEGCSSIADAAGNLLFYTNGETVWNKQHNIMANGTGLFGDNSATQSALIIKQPGSTNQYYIFTMAAFGGTTGFNYSIVDMSLAAGVGSVIVKNTPLYSAPCTEQLHATKHADGVDYWVMIHELNTNNFRAYLLSASGVNTTALISSVGTTYSVTSGYFGACMKFSPTGQKLALVAQSPSVVELYDFNNSTGSVSNPFTIPMNGYGCEFSPDGTKLYSSSSAATMQWNLSAGSNAAIISSSVNLSALIIAPGGMMQLAPNGKIYIATNGAQSISVINNPNAGGLACNLVYGAQSVSAAINPTLSPLGSLSQAGLPNMVQPSCSGMSITSLGSHVDVICNGASGSFGAVSVSGGFGNINYLWSNGTTNYTTQQVNNLSAGQWSLTVSNDFACSTQTVFTVIQLPPSTLTPLVANSNLNVCIGGSATITASGANSYTWSTGVQSSSLVVTPANNTQYYVSATDQNGCVVNSAAITVSVTPPPTLSTNASNSFTLCSPQIQTLTVSGAYSYLWKWGTTAWATSTFLLINPGVTTQYSITGTDSLGCASSKVLTVTIGCVGVGELEISNSGFLIYPNPADEILNVEWKENAGFSTSLRQAQGSALEMTIVDVLGKEIKNEEFKITTGAAQIDVSRLPSGIYFVKLKNTTRKFVKQ